MEEPVLHYLFICHTASLLLQLLLDVAAGAIAWDADSHLDFDARGIPRTLQDWKRRRGARKEGHQSMIVEQGCKQCNGNMLD